MRKAAVLLLMIFAFAAQSSNSIWAQAEKKDAPPEPKIKVGDTFPDFTLIDQNRNKVSLHDFKGKKNVALAFVVFAFTGG
jgi:cytochrome oxidase Cu insertion factor (SCO1/SenC/PrrC family)